MFRISIVLLAVSLAVAPRMVQAQPQPLSAARLHVSVEIDSQNMFVYRYIVENGAGSTAGISRMTIDISSRAGAAVPVTFSAPQPGWRTTAGADATARWVATNDRSLIVAKQRLAGFSLSSNSPPSISNSRSLLTSIRSLRQLRSRQTIPENKYDTARNSITTSSRKV